MWFYWFQNQQLNMNCFVYLCSPILDVSGLFSEMVQYGLRCTAFCRSRELCELFLCYTYVSLTGVVWSYMHDLWPLKLCLLLFACTCCCWGFYVKFSSIVGKCRTCWTQIFMFVIGVKFSRRQHHNSWTLYVLIVLATLLRSVGFLPFMHDSLLCFA